MTEPVVELKSGLVRGVAEKHEDGFDYYSFKGVPYAEPPVGELRFKDPISKRKWSGIIDCKNYSFSCSQERLFTEEKICNEDCLYLNVFTRTINEPNKNIPVIMIIHGGGFAFGSGDDLIYGPQHLIRKNIVLVTFNYRLGILGFLNLEDEVAPGNQGLKDQLMVLKWIQQNIGAFGGDANNVTVFGYSAGAASAHYLSLSPLTKGLMHKVISQGGVLFNPWVYNSNPKINAIKLCALLGNNSTESKEMYEFLKKVDAKELLEAQLQLTKITGTWPFGPGDDSKSLNAFMANSLKIASEQGVHLPYLTGWNSHQGLTTLYGLTREEFLRMCDQDFAACIKFNLDRVLRRYNLNKTQVRRFYFGSEVISEKNLDKFVNFATDLYFTEPIHRFAKIQAKYSSAPTYLYRFSYDPPDLFMRNWLKDAPRGPSHCDDLPYIFKMRYFDVFGLEHFKKGTKHYELIEQMTEMWVNFATYGKPTIDKSELTPVHWKPITDGTILRFLNIDEDITMQSSVNVAEKLVSAQNIKT